MRARGMGLGESDPTADFGDRGTSGCALPFDIAEYCRCGGAVTATVRSSVDEPKIRQAVEIFWRVHADPECGRCDAITAARARRRAENQRERAELAETRRLRGG